MKRTAVGLFENPGSADEVVRDLETTGFPRKDIRVLGEPREMAGSGLMSTPRTDFEVDLIRDLTAFGSSKQTPNLMFKGYGAEASWFSQRVRAKRPTRLLRL